MLIRFHVYPYITDYLMSRSVLERAQCGGGYFKGLLQASTTSYALQLGRYHIN